MNRRENRKSSKDADVVLERNERDDDESEEEIPISDEESVNDSNAEAVEATSNAPRKESQSGDGRFVITDEEYKGLPYPPTYFTYAGKGSGKESFLFNCHLDHCQTKKKTISVTKVSRGNIRKHLKVCHPSSLDSFNGLCNELDATKGANKSLKKNNNQRW
ncbi:uncharacterized protein LOC116923163 [Daphnia magna]|uniref:uncharacterized protein LOC116923163 n=1 Tax=Daphnia magna TaxID=35525 RepID=UPI00140226C1|nr:uncharacterized protein LOC116923163 [Daphnia magna]